MFLRDPLTARVGKEILPFEVGYLSEFFQRKAEFELHDAPEKRAQGIRQLKEMVKRDEQMRNIEFDDDFLLQYLFVRKFNVDRAFSQLKESINFSRKYPKLFNNLQFEKIVKVMTDKILTILPRRCQDGCVIVLMVLDNWNPEKIPLDDVKGCITILFLQSLRDPMTQVNGFKVIFDLKSNPIKHLRYCTPQNLHILYHGTQECVPGRFKGFHVLNKSLTFRAIWPIIKYFMTDKVKQRIHFHSSSESLKNFFPLAVLPVHYGGDLEHYDMTPWLRKVMSPEQLATMGSGSLYLN